MKRPGILLTCLVLLGISISLSAQKNCATMDYLEQQQQLDPDRINRLEAIERHTQQVLQGGARAVEGVITIPVVFHIVYNTASQNISDAQIQSQIDILNEDFRRLNADAVNTPSVFQGVAADVEIQFCLASRDPDGFATTGITRTPTTVSSHGTDNSVKFDSQGGKNAWPAGEYLNFWVCSIGSGILGYAQFPGGNPSTDGVVCDYRYIGNIGTATAPYDLGRTATHEVGHWLNLRHIWGDGGCGVDDFVADTPLAGNSNGTSFPCTFPGPNSCNEGPDDLPDMFQNYMDYSADGCMNLFTSGQKDRMRALFEPGGDRESLLNSNGCGTGTPASCEDGVQNGDETGVDCGGSTCEPCPCSESPLTLTIVLDNYPSETSWDVTNATGAVVASGGTYDSQPNGSTVVETINLASGDYTFTIYDSYNDGICCLYGNGSYTLTDANGLVIATGGEFTTSESTEFCSSGGGTAPTCDDGIQNGQETGVDCGGPDCPACPTEPTCDDGIQNGQETGVDCGGPDCPACPTCDDGIQNGQETGVDCGGPDCAACPTEPTCDDGIQNGQETGVDCGGPDCPACPTDPTCDDGVQNGQETGIDCGGPDCPACPDVCPENAISISITFDNFPEETSWDIRSGSVVLASGGPYSGQPDRSTLVEELCLPDGCYDFTIYDSYGDGICCTYGPGSYTVTNDANGTVLANGGSFGSSETSNFCVGGGAQPSCTDGIQNGQETGVDCGGPDCPACPTEPSCDDGFQNGQETGVDCGGPDCPACPTEPTCDDGVQNGDETGVDCGGSCAPCDPGACSTVTINSNDFEGGYGIWNDGGSDCRISGSDQAYANSGFYCVRLRDNSNASVVTTDDLNLTSFEEISVDFSYYARSMDNPNEDFWLQISYNGGASYITVEEWNLGDEFQNNQRKFDNVVIPGPFSANTRLRFRCDASSNSDYVYLDDVTISGCQSGNRLGENVRGEVHASSPSLHKTETGSLSNVSLFPNPTRDQLTLGFDMVKTANVQLILTDLSGKVIKQEQATFETGPQQKNMDVSRLSPGIYFIHFLTKDERIAKKFVIIQ